MDMGINSRKRPKAKKTHDDSKLPTSEIWQTLFVGKRRKVPITIVFSVTFIVHSILVPRQVPVKCRLFRFLQSRLCGPLVGWFSILLNDSMSSFQVHILLGRIVKLQFLAQFPVDHLSHQVVLNYYYYIENNYFVSVHVANKFPWSPKWKRKKERKKKIKER